MLDEGLSNDLLVVIGVDEVGVIREPAHGENDYHYDKHLNHLGEEKKDEYSFSSCLTLVVNLAELDRQREKGRNFLFALCFFFFGILSSPS